MSESRSTPPSDANPHGCRHPSWKRSAEKPGKVACELCGAVGDELRYIKLDDPQLDLRDTFTRIFVLAEYWQHEALSARQKLETLPLQSESAAIVQVLPLAQQPATVTTSTEVPCIGCLTKFDCIQHGQCLGVHSTSQFDCHYDGDINRCDKDCKQLGECKRRTGGQVTERLDSQSPADKLDLSTPRTDALIAEHIDDEGKRDHAEEAYDLCHQLERELAEANHRANTFHDGLMRCAQEAVEAKATRSAGTRIVRKERADLPELISYWRTKDRGSDQYAAADIIERLLRDLEVAEGLERMAYDQRDKAFAQSASERTDPFAEMMKRRNADADICYPGNHGGPDGKWLVTLTMQDANLIEEYFGDTLTETLEKATMSRVPSTRGVKP